MTRTWKVIYQNVPYNYTDARTLVIEADSREAALVTAYDHLTRQGLNINPDTVTYDLNAIAPHVEPRIDWDVVKSLGWPTNCTNGSTHIRSIAEHAPVVTGKVVAA